MAPPSPIAMHDSAPLVALALALAIAALSVVARRIRIASPLLMLVAGAAIAFVPGMPAVRLDPDVVLLALLPPLLYSSGVGMSWRGFRARLRPILLLAIGCVLFTATAVAAIAHYALGLSWAVGFVLGAIVSPPDVVAPMAILRSIPLPRRITTVLEGESLVNDATALVTFGFATAAVVSGTFSPLRAAGELVAIAGGETLFGIAVGWTMLRLRHVAADPRAEVMLALATPFLAFWPPHALGGSGVIACVATGLYVSWNGRLLIRPDTRLQGYFIWDLVTWGVEALVFLLAGLQARAVVGALAGDGWSRALVAGAVVTASVIVVRFVWVFAAEWLPALLAVRPRPRDWREAFLVSFAGLRGVVSLVAALLVPVTIDGRPFPDRDIVLFATYCVIVGTLVGLGAALPAVVRMLGLDAAGSGESAANKRDEQRVRIEGIDAVLRAIEDACRHGMPRAAVETVKRRNVDRRRAILEAADPASPEDPVADTAALELRLVDVERRTIAGAYAANRITDEARRRIERELDLEEARVRHALESGSAGHPATPATGS